MQHRGSRAARLAGQGRRTAGGGLNKHHAKAFRVAVDLAVGHGEQVRGTIPARQVIGRDMAEQVHTFFHIQFGGQTEEIVAVLTNADDGVMYIQPLRLQCGQ